MTTPNPTNAAASRAQRVAWFCAGVGCALGLLSLLDSAQARRSPVATSAAALAPALGPALASPLASSLGPAPSLLLPAAVSPAPRPQGTNETRPFPVTSSGVTGDSNNRMIAVTGNDITGQSVLYLVDTIDKQLAVYQASGGAPGTQNVKLVGARNISLDLQLDGLNDRTEVDKQPLTFKDLERRMSGRSSSDDSR